MAEYFKMDFNKLKFCSTSLSYEEVISRSEPLEIKPHMLDDNGFLKAEINKEDCKNGRVKFEFR